MFTKLLIFGITGIYPRGIIRCCQTFGTSRSHHRATKLLSEILTLDGSAFGDRMDWMRRNNRNASFCPIPQ